MSTDYWLVDHEGRNALDVGTWYDLDVRVGEVVPLDAIRAATDTKGPWIAVAAESWIRDVCKGRPVVLGMEQADDEWQGFDDETCRFYAQPGWTLWTVYTRGTGEHLKLWHPPEVAALVHAYGAACPVCRGPCTLTATP